MKSLSVKLALCLAVLVVIVESSCIILAYGEWGRGT